MRDLVAVLIPLYRPILTADEAVSLTSFATHLRRYPRILLSPEGLDVTTAKAVDPGLRVEYFPREHFASWAAYNSFCKSRLLYDRFWRFEFVLIAQLDAYVFRDELEYWCERGFAYLGTRGRGIDRGGGTGFSRIAVGVASASGKCG